MDSPSRGRNRILPPTIGSPPPRNMSESAPKAVFLSYADQDMVALIHAIEGQSRD